MELVRENETIRTATVDVEAQAHNALIRERYRRLQNAEAEQFTENHVTEERFSEVSNVEAPAVYAAPVTENVSEVEQVPQVTEFVHVRPEASVFTTDKFERLQQSERVAPSAVSVAPVYVAPVTVSAVATEAQYSLSALAKIAMAVFTFVIVAMLTMICVNTQLINQKRIKLKNLEEQKEELLEKNEEIQRRIEQATSEDTIRQYAAANGWFVAGN